MLFAPAFILNDICICFVRNDGNPRLSMFAMLTGSLSNIILDYLFIFPLDMGIFGAVLATGMAPVISMLILSMHWLKGKNRFHLQKTGMSAEMIFSILPLGFPSLITELASGIVMIAFNRIILRLQGNTGLPPMGWLPICPLWFFPYIPESPRGCSRWSADFMEKGTQKKEIGS